ncbi:MAG: MarR family transcriptional regulator [Candidatus Dormibacteria bacterium]|jgi:DNA-binding MarR family transcriptional regulator
MEEQSRPAYHLGDLLALAREHWVRQMAEHVNRAGFDDYRRTDAAVMRLLSRRPRSIGQIGAALGVTRQAARKFVTRLEGRGFVVTGRDASDARQVNVELTGRGAEYARAIRGAIDALDRRLAQRVERAQLLAADAVLRATLPDEDARERAMRLVPPP